MTRSGFAGPSTRGFTRPAWNGPPRRPDGSAARMIPQVSPVADRGQFQYVGTAAEEAVAERVRSRETSQLSRLSQEAPRVPWDVFLNDVLQWRNGEHFALIGPTGGGKTTMARALLPLHYYVTVFATKPYDETMDALIRSGYYRMDQWRSLPADEYPKRVVWPNIARLKGKQERLELQRRVFDNAFDAIFLEKGWTLYLDELWYFSNRLNMDGWVEEYLSQARSLSISLIVATQRPAFIPLMVYDQSTHLMFWRDNDEANLRRLSGISFRSADLIRSIVSNLEPHQVLYINTRTGRMYRTRGPDIR
jgi:energy-coupling factor transporter ATP-binding protein EcfA2